MKLNPRLSVTAVQLCLQRRLAFPGLEKSFRDVPLGGTPQKFWMGVCALPWPAAGKCYPISDLTQNSVSYFRPSLNSWPDNQSHMSEEELYPIAGQSAHTLLYF